MSENNTARKGLRRLGGVIVAGLLAGGVMASPADASTGTELARAARSVEVFLSNNTGCALRLVSARLDHGEWTRQPPAEIRVGRLVSWESESNGIATGTEGEADYITHSCDVANNNTKRVHLHWNNPFVGGNSYDAAGTDPAFHVNIVGGSGHHAGVQFTFSTPN
jgi:hypothetical protein